MFEILAAVQANIELNKEQKLNSDHYPVFKNCEIDPEKFWDGLNKGKFHLSWDNKKQYHNKIDVGNLAIHNGLMTPNTRSFDIGKTKYKDLSKRQQKIITQTLKYKDELYQVINIRQCIGNLYRVK